MSRRCAGNNQPRNPPGSLRGCPPFRQVAQCKRRSSARCNRHHKGRIVSDKPLEISDAILRNIHHGATLLYGQGAFSGVEKKIVFAIVDLTQITRVRHLIEDIDPSAFLFIMNTTDVIGRGFTRPLSTAHNMPHSVRYICDKEGNLVPTHMWSYEMESEAHPDDEEKGK